VDGFSSEFTDFLIGGRALRAASEKFQSNLIFKSHDLLDSPYFQPERMMLQEDFKR
jgi:hypothetical protein